MPYGLSADPLRALVGWRATEGRWQAFWDRWSNGQIQLQHWLKRDAAPFHLRWFGGELQLDLTYEPGTLTLPETWALRGMRLTAIAGRSLSLEWGWDIDPYAADLIKLEQRLGVMARRHVNGASFFWSRADGVELAVQLDWVLGHAGPLRGLSIASLGTPIATPDCSTFGQSNCSRQDVEIMRGRA